MNVTCAVTDWPAPGVTERTVTWLSYEVEVPLAKEDHEGPRSFGLSMSQACSWTDAAEQAGVPLSEVPQHARVGLMRLDRLLAEAWVAPRGAPLAGWLPTRLNSRLHRLLYLADLVMAHTSVEHGVGTSQTHGFVIDLAQLFVDLLARRLLGEAYQGLTSQKAFDLDSLGRLKFKPDLVFNDLLAGQDAVAVADTKYKLLGDGARSRLTTSTNS